MEEKYYICQFCKEEFTPTRRKIQKFCSHTCRSKNHQHKNNTNNELTEAQKFIIEAFPEKLQKIEEMSVSGIGNAALGGLLANAATSVAKNVFKSKENQPATKGDVEKLKQLIENQYFQVHNIRPDAYGRLAYFDMVTSKIVYYDENTNQLILPDYDL